MLSLRAAPRRAAAAPCGRVALGLASLLALASLPAVAADRALFRLADAGAVEWRAINDGVMGGLSAGGAWTTAGGTLVFAGVVSLENNGGFASIRSVPAALGLGGARGLRLVVRGDGKRYKVNLKTDPGFDGVQYQRAFVAPAGEWATVDLPFEAFAATFRGRPVPGAAPLDPARVVTVGLLIGDKQQGRFELELRSIDAYRD